MGHRWYDCDSTLSMAVSLLQSVSKQQRAAVVAEALDALLEMYPELSTTAEASAGVAFFWKRRNGWTADMWRLLALIEQLPETERRQVALWILDALVHFDAHEPAQQALQGQSPYAY